jgi:hypothetical protein
MTRRAGLAVILIFGLLLAALATAGDAHAIEVKKKLYGGGGGSGGSGGAPAPPNPLTPALRQKLAETIATESDSYLDQESEKKSSGETFVDLEGAKFKYFPVMKGSKVEVTAKLEGPEYKAPKEGGGKGHATGKRRALVFKYRLDGQQWTETEQPAWQDVEEGKKAAK